MYKRQSQDVPSFPYFFSGKVQPVICRNPAHAFFFEKNGIPWKIPTMCNISAHNLATFVPEKDKHHGIQSLQKVHLAGRYDPPVRADHAGRDPRPLAAQRAL